MSRFRQTLRRNRGLLAAIGIILVALPATLWFWQPGPRISWTVPIRYSKEIPDEFGEFVEFSPDGRFVYTSNATGARIQDLATGKVRELSPGELVGGLRAMGGWFLEGGRFVLGRLVEPPPRQNVPLLRIWEASTGQEWVKIPELGENSGLSNWVVSADDSTLAYPPRYHNPCGKVPSVGVWKSAWGREVRTFRGVDPIALSGDGRFLAVGGPEHPMASVLVYDVDSGKEVASLPVGPEVGSMSLALSSDGKLLAENQAPNTVLWDVATATRRAVLETFAYPTRFGAGDSLLLLGSQSTVLDLSEVWDLTTSPPRSIFQGVIWYASTDGRRIVKLSAAPADSLKSNVQAELVEFPLGSPVSRRSESEFDCTFSPDGRLVAAFERRTERSPLAGYFRYLPRFLRPRTSPLREVKQIRVIDTRTGQNLAKVELPQEFSGAPDYKLLADGKTLAFHYVLAAEEGVTDATARIELWDVPARPFPWPIAGCVAALTVALGVIIDVRARRRSTPASVPA